MPTTVTQVTVSSAAECVTTDDDFYCGENHYNTCTDSHDGVYRGSFWGTGCSRFETDDVWCGTYDDEDFSSNLMCCVCGGGDRTGCVSCPAGQISHLGAKSLDDCVDPNCDEDEYFDTHYLICLPIEFYVERSANRQPDFRT